MKKLHATKPNTPVVPQHRSFRRLVRKMFASLIKRQNPHYSDEVLQRLKNLERKIEIMAREMVPQKRRGKSPLA